MVWLVAGAMAAPELWVAPDGMRVLIDAEPSDSLVSMARLVDVGSGQPDGALAHLAEHLWYRAPANSSTVRHLLDGAGCARNAATYHDVTVFYETCPEAALPLLLQLTDELFEQGVSGVTEASLALERSIIGREEVEDVASGTLAARALWRLMTDGQDAPDEVAASMQRMVLWTRTHWRRERATLVLSGAVDVPTVVRRWSLERLDNEGRGASEQEGLSAEEGPSTGRQVEILSPGGPVVMAGWPMPGWDVQSVEAIERLASQGLFRGLWEQPGYRVSSCSAVEVTAGLSALVCHVVVGSEAALEGLPQRIGRAMQSALSATRGRSNRPVVAEALAAAPARIAWERHRHASRASVSVARRVHAGLPPVQTSEPSLEPRDLLVAARALITAQRQHSVVVRPVPLVDAVTLHAAVDAAPSSAPARVGTAGLVVAERRLHNGIPLVVATLPDAGTTAVSLVVGGGTQLSPYGVVDYAERWSYTPEGPGDRALVSSTRILSDAVVHRWVGSTDGLPAILDAVKRTVRQRRAARWSGIFQLAELQKFEVLRRWRSARWWARRLRWNRVNPDHRVLFELGLEEFHWMKSSPVRAVERYLTRAYQPDNLSLIVITEDGADEVVTAAKGLGRWPGHASDVSDPAPPSAPKESAAFVLQGRRPYSEVAVTCPLPEAVDPAVASVARRVVREGLYERLRVQRGRIYTPSVVLRRSRGGSAQLTAQVDVGSLGLDTVVAEVGLALQPSEDAVGRAAALEGHLLLRSLGTPPDALRVLEERVRLRLSVTDVSEAPGRVAGADPKAVLDALATCGANRALTIVAPWGVQVPEDLERVNWRAASAEWLERAGEAVPED